MPILALETGNLVQAYRGGCRPAVGWISFADGLSQLRQLRYEPVVVLQSDVEAFDRHSHAEDAGFGGR